MAMIMVMMKVMMVAPHVGAWIEITTPYNQQATAPGVAPHVGAWIEITTPYNQQATAPGVAPHVGAWIEIG